MWLYNKKLSSPSVGREVWDLVDYYGSRLETFNGTLVAGDPIQNNVWTLFSGLDDDGSTIPNYWEGKLTRLQIESLKRLKKFVIQGLIGDGQSAEVGLATDRGSFVTIGTIDSTASYVDRSAAVVIGGQTLGSEPLGGESSDIIAFPYTREFNWNELNVDIFCEIKTRFEATDIGYFSVSKIQYEDLRVKSDGRTVPFKYRS